ncbi:alpha/beta hydrolase [Calycomorphotria hydatis]|uniref:Alpha/beta hydrolase family protein n=1 Tax=Calycomorphotria hydatis TaxID=2528027 RepID=A0A517T5J8_9PLAN|nr:alpha/beta fold hydrolase [Calycomorphotria hydatis]QDT63638.1 Alpha/beta hydrolase family protein [Calycomorphotria hydatis]
MDWLWYILIAVAVLAVLDIVPRAIVVWLALPIFEQKPSFNPHTAEPRPGTSPFQVTTTDGRTLVGDVIPRNDSDQPARGLVIFCHEYGGNRWTACDYAAGLLDDGWDVLTFDFRNHGDSDSEPNYVPVHWLTEFEVRDTIAALRYAKTLDEYADKPLCIYGVSRGANAGMTAAGREGGVDRVIADGAFSIDTMIVYYTLHWCELYVPRKWVEMIPKWHLRETMKLVRILSQWRHGVKYVVAEKELPKLKGTPTLMITGERDTYVAPEIAQGMAKRIGDSCEPVWVVPKAKHNLARVVAKEEYETRLRDFCAEACETRQEPMTEAATTT